VRSYRTFSPLPFGGIFSAALSVIAFAIPRRYLAFYPAEPGLSSDNISDYSVSSFRLYYFFL
tara:strand:+ start:151 stop:336 length:186 start_codon:yes stop_codon:yes gene_type:complete